MRIAKNPLFIVIEGTDGSGKSTQIEKLEVWLKSAGSKVWVTQEPSDRPIGRLIRKVISKEFEVSNQVLAGLFFSDRMDHLDNKEDGILRQLDDDYTVVCDRYYLSSLAYNSLSSSMDWVYDLNRPCMDLRRPDITFFLDLEVEQSLDRIRTNRTSFDLFEKKEILGEVRKNYKRAIAMLKDEEIIVTIDASQNIDQIHREIVENICDLQGVNI